MYLSEFNSTFTKNVRLAFDNSFMQSMDRSAYTKFFEVADTTELVEKFDSTESIKLPNFVGESQNGVTRQLGKGYVSFFEGFGAENNIIISKLARLGARDDTTVLQELLRREQAVAIMSFEVMIEQRAHLWFNNPTSTTATYQGKTFSLVGPDLLPFLDNAHAWNSTTATFDNLLPAAALSVDVVRQVEAIGGAFLDAEGNQKPIRFDTVIAKKGGKGSFNAKQIFGINNGQYSPTTVGVINIFEGSDYTLIETPYMDNTDSYFFWDSKLENPLFLHFLQRPSLEGPAFQNPNNLDWIYSFYANRKGGLRNVPFAWIGSIGAP